MSLGAVVDALALRLRAELGPGPKIGDALPLGPSDLPAVTLTIAGAGERLAGVGKVPRGPRRGALEVQTTVDLADPVLRQGGDEVRLLSEDRRELILPHGQLVRADGTDEPPFDDDDLSAIAPGGAFDVVAGEPAGRQVRPDPARGVLRFGQALPPNGTLSLTYHLGQWDVTTLRFAGDLAVEVTAQDLASVTSLTRQTAAALDDPTADFRVLSPSAWGAARRASISPAAARAQTLAYRFEFETEQPSLVSGGGVIRTVAVSGHVDATTERFDVTHEGSTG